MTDVAFVIPSYNSYKTIARTLTSILSQKLFAQIKEIFIVDSSDDQKTRELLNEFKNDKLRIILLNQKTCPAMGRNTGAQQSNADLLCFIDSDVYLDENWLESILSAYKSNCKVGGGSISLPDFQQNNNLARAQLYLQFNESLVAGTRRPLVMVPACNMFIERALFEKAGGFPNLRASEDVLLSLRLAEWTKIWFVPEAKCFHVFREDLRSYFNNQKILGKYIIIYRRMISNKWCYKSLWPLMLLPGFLLIKVLRINLRIWSAGWGHYKEFISSLPLFGAGLFYWTVGFAQGCFLKE